jgi:hypothetical protein
MRDVAEVNITSHQGLPSSELILTVPLCPGRRVRTVPLELNSRVRVPPQLLGGATAPLSPPEQSGSKVTSFIFVPSGSSRGAGGVSESIVGVESPPS